MLQDTHWNPVRDMEAALAALEAQQRTAVDAAVDRLIAAATDTGTAGSIDDARFELRQGIQRLTETIRRQGR